MVYTPFHCNLGIFSKVSKNHVHVCPPMSHGIGESSQTVIVSIPPDHSSHFVKLCLSPSVSLCLTAEVDKHFIPCSPVFAKSEVARELEKSGLICVLVATVRRFQICISLNLSQYLATLAPVFGYSVIFAPIAVIKFIPITEGCSSCIYSLKCKTWAYFKIQLIHRNCNI